MHSDRFMERYIDMKSPLTGGRVKEVTTNETHTFRGYSFDVTARYYVCEDTGERFTETSQDAALLNELYSQYRLKVGIPFQDEIKAVREKYGLNLSQMNRILGFGANQYARYEEGYMPSESNGKMLKSIEKKDIMLNYLELARSEFSDVEYGRIRNKVMAAHEEENQVVERNIFYSNTERSILNGFSELAPSKLKAMVEFFVSQEVELFPTKLNKEMFYADFLHFRNHGRSISGLKYQAIQFGPVPYRFATVYDNVESLIKEYVISHEQECLKLRCPAADISILSDAELETLATVIEKTRTMSTSQLIEESHKEVCWISHSGDRSFIPYSESCTLRFL